MDNKIIKNVVFEDFKDQNPASKKLIEDLENYFEAMLASLRKEINATLLEFQRKS